jgi:hypothetical protein
MRVVCAWCKKLIRVVDDAPPLKSPGGITLENVSHGICEECLKKELPKYAAA